MEKGLTQSSSPVAEDEIDLLALIKMVWGKRRLIIRIIIYFTLLGVVVALLSQKEYTASGVYLPQTAEGAKAGGSLSGLASLAGINLGSGQGGGSEIPPSLYPKIIGSVPFKKEMLKARLSFEGLEEKVSYREYYDKYHSPGFLDYLKKYTLGLPGVIIAALKGGKEEDQLKNGEESSIISFDQEELGHFKRLDDQVTVSFNDKEGFVELSTLMPEPLAAAQLAKYAEAVLQKEVIAFKVKNAKEQLLFTEERYREKKKEFEIIQEKLARFRDRNRNIATSIAESQLEELEAEYDLVLSVYSELAKQLEQAKLQVSKETPVFSVVQPITVPIEKSSPNRPLILIGFIFSGIVIALGVVFGGEFFKGLKEQWNKE